MCFGQRLRRPLAALIVVGIAKFASVCRAPIEGKTSIGINQHMLMHMAEALCQVIARVFGAPHQAAQPPPRKHLLHQQFQPRAVFIVDADQNHAVAGQQFTRQRQALVQKLQPLAVAVAVVGPDVVVVIDPVFVAGVVGWVNVNDADFSGMGGAQQAQAVKVIALDDEILVLAGVGRAVAGLCVQARQHDVGVQGRIALDGARLPIQPHFLLG